MCNGLFKIVSPWKENSSTSMNNNPAVVAPSNLVKNFFSKYANPFLFITLTLVKIPLASGITTNRTTDNISVSHGTVTLLTPSSNFTIGINATKMIKLLIAT